MPTINISNPVGNVEIEPGDLVTVTGVSAVGAGESIKKFNPAFILTVDGTPADNTFVVTIDGQSVSVVGDTDINTTAGNLVTALNASILSNFTTITWDNPLGAKIRGIPDIGESDPLYVLSVTGSGSATVTDFLFELTILMNTNVTLTQSSTGILNIQGVRQKYVHFQSSAANPEIADWGFVSTNAGDISSLRWAICSNGTFGILVFQGGTPSAGKYNYNIIRKCNSALFFNNSSGAGTLICDDIVGIETKAVVTKTGSKAQICSRWYVDERVGAGAAGAFGGVTKMSTWNDIYLGQSTKPINFAPVAGNTITVNRLYFLNLVQSNAGFSQFGGAGNLIMDACDLRGGGIGLQLTLAGNITISNSDITQASGNGVGFKGILATAGTIDSDNNHVSGTTDREDDDVDLSSGEIGDQHDVGVGGTYTNPKTLRNTEKAYTSIAQVTSVVEEITVTFNTGILASSYVVFRNTIDGPIVAASMPDAPDAYIAVIDATIPTKVSDFGIKGEKYSKTHSIKTKLPSGTYFTQIISKDIHDEVFESAVQSSITITGAAPAPLFPDIELEIDQEIVLEIAQ